MSVSYLAPRGSADLTIAGCLQPATVSRSHATFDSIRWPQLPNIHQQTPPVAGPQQAPYSIQVTRTLHVLPPLTLDKLHLDFFGDSQVSVGLDSQGTLSAQVAQNLEIGRASCRERV